MRQAAEQNAPIRTAFVAVGSNIEPERNIPAALEALARFVRVTGSSTFYRTAPVARPGQPAFYNGVFQAQTGLAARALKFDVLRPIEERLGRVRTADKDAPRTIDLDLLLCGDEVIDTPELRLPDPEIRVRPFVAVPLLELCPELLLPGTGEPLRAFPAARASQALERLTEFTHQLRKRLEK